MLLPVVKRNQFLQRLAAVFTEDVSQDGPLRLSRDALLEARCRRVEVRVVFGGS